MSRNEDLVPESYPYHWSPGNANLTIEEFVAKYKPSMVQDDGKKPWLWIQNSNSGGGDDNKEEAIEEATALLTEVTTKVESIKNDDKIPTRSNKKTGAKSKKELREQVQSEASQRLKDIHTNHGYKAGKWLVFVPPDKVDNIWSRIATSVVTGPLSKTSVNMAKVSTTPSNESSAQRIICVYLPDVFDQSKVTEVMRILLRNHGVNLSGVKSNLYTEIGLDSKHSSGIQSTIWKNTALLKEVEMKELKDKFFADLQANQDKGELNFKAKSKKPSEKPRVATDDPFASDDEQEEQEKSKPKPKPVEDPFGSSDDDQPNSQEKLSKRKKPSDDHEDKEQEKPKKARKRGD